MKSDATNWVVGSGEFENGRYDLSKYHGSRQQDQIYR